MTDQPFFSISIPQFNRSDKLLRLLKSIHSQNYTSYEVCISDGFSTDNSLEIANNYLSEKGMNFKISKSEVGRKYDENIRNAIDISSGRFIILMGNDDKFCNPNTFTSLHNILKPLINSDFGFLVTNFKDLETDKVYYRVGEDLNTKIIYKISEIFRSLSFVSGLVFNGDHIRSYSSDKIDGSEMYQMYLAARSLANNKYARLSSMVTVSKDPGDGPLNLELLKLPLPMSKIPNAIAFGMGLKKGEFSQELKSVIFQLYLYIYPYWMYMYKTGHKNEIWLKFCSSLNPNKLVFEHGVIGSKFNVLILLILHYLAVTICIITPKALFNMYLPLLHKIAKRRLRGSV